MKIFLTADSHINHEAIKKYCGRPDNYESLIWKEYKQLKKEHMLVHLGDICWGNEIAIHEKLELLPCKKILVKGNHDSKSDHWYLTHGWDFVCQSFTLKKYGKIIVFSHRPKAWDGYFDINIHGHLHNSQHHLENKLLGIQRHGQILICIEDLNYKLISLEGVLHKTFYNEKK